MKRPPYPARVAAGVLVTTVEETKKLPTRIITLPMSAVSRGLQAGMRLQQNIAEMAIKGDEFFAGYTDAEQEQPEWARFDEDDVPPAVTELRGKPAAKKATKTAAKPAAKTDDSVEAEAPAPASGRFALYSSPPADLAATSASPSAAKNGSSASGTSPEIVDLLDYDQLTLAQLRAQLRGLDVDDLQSLADYERGNRNRAPFLTMIDNRVASQQKKSEAGQ